MFTWFDNELMKSNADKCHLLVSSNEKVTIKIGGHENANTKPDKLLGVHLDSGFHLIIVYQKFAKKQVVR